MIYRQGIGGGFIANIYKHDERQAYTLNAKESAPQAAHEDMFKTDTEYLKSVKTIAVPGEVKGYWELHQKYGKLPWKELVEPTIKLCEEGFTMSRHMYDSVLLQKDALLGDKNLR